MLHPIRFTAAALTVGAVIFASAGVASAHDFSPSASTPACVNMNGIPTKVVTVTVTNNYDLAATGTSTYLSGSPFSVPAGAGATGHYELRKSGSTVGDATDDVALTWTDGFSIHHTVIIHWGGTPCEGTPTTTSTTAPVYVPPPSGGAVPPPPATTVPEAPTSPVATSTAPPPVVSTNDTPTAVQRPTTTAAHPVPTALPTTGSSSTPFILAGFSLGLAGIVLVTVTRRRAS